MSTMADLDEPLTPSRTGPFRELAPTLRLAAPVVAAELGWMLMGTIDTYMVGRLGAEAVGAVGLGNSLFYLVFMFPNGLLLGLDPMVSQAFGAGDRDDCRKTLWHGLYLAAVVAPVAMLACLALLPLFGPIGIDSGVTRLTGPYMKAMIWSVPPLLVFSSLRHYLQAMGRVRSMVLALVVGNLLNLVGNWALINGHLGLPALGVEGSGWSTTLSRMVMPIFLAVDAWRVSSDRGRGMVAVEWERLRRLVRLGMPAAVHLTLEVGVFSLATMLAGRLGASTLAAHQIVLNMASTSFMVPLGIASAGSVLVGQALGRRHPSEAAAAGWTSLALGAGFMAIAGLIMSIMPRALVGVFSTDPNVLRIGAGLIFVAAVFQLFDGVQVVCTGILRGASETRLPMVTNFVAHWLIGLPIGYVLGLRLGWGALGLWIGLSVGLILAGCVLLVAWTRKSRAFAAWKPS